MTGIPVRTPLSVLAVRPKTKAPPPILHSSYSPSVNVLANIPANYDETAEITMPLMSPLDEPQLLPVTPNEGILLPIIYQRPSLLSSPKARNLGVVTIPTVGRQLPTVIPIVQPKSPLKNPPQSALFRSKSPSSRVTLPVAYPRSYPANMAGTFPPTGEEEQVIVNVPSVALSNKGLISYSRPVDVMSYAISPDSSPLPLEETQQPVVLSPTPVTFAVPASSTASLPRYISAPIRSSKIARPMIIIPPRG